MVILMLGEIFIIVKVMALVTVGMIFVICVMALVMMVVMSISVVVLMVLMIVMMVVISLVMMTYHRHCNHEPNHDKQTTFSMKIIDMTRNGQEIITTATIIIRNVTITKNICTYQL
jgi:ABC-type transport system involved in cytochrome bd biosynthesis fused ATPase/permease subunit